MANLTFGDRFMMENIVALGGDSVSEQQQLLSTGEADRFVAIFRAITGTESVGARRMQ
jgi:hypothetical protein